MHTSAIKISCYYLGTQQGCLLKALPMFWLLQLFTRIHAVPLSSPPHLIFDPSSLSLLTLCFDSPLQDTAASIFLFLPLIHCNAMQNCLSLVPKRRLRFSTLGFMPAMFFYLPCPFQTPCPSETPPVSISVLSFPNPSLVPPLQRKAFSSPERCRLLAAGGRTPGFVRSSWTAAALCRSTRSACLQLLAERLHGEGVFLYHLHTHCTRSHPSFQRASRFSPRCLTPSHKLFSHTFLVSGYWALPQKCPLKPMCNPLWGCPLRAAVCFWSQCAIYHTSTTHLPLAIYFEKIVWRTNIEMTIWLYLSTHLSSYHYNIPLLWTLRLLLMKWFKSGN